MDTAVRKVRQVRKVRKVPFGVGFAVLIALVNPLVELRPSAHGGAQTDGRAVVQRMHDAYAGKWFKTLTFVQKTTIARADGSNVEQTWYESYQAPGKLRIDTAPMADGNGTLQMPDKVIVVRGGKVSATRPSGNPFLPFVGDIYAQPVEASVAQLAAEKYDLSKTHTAELTGRRTIVVGAASKDDLTSPQFWVDAERLVVVRAILPSGAAGAPPLDIALDRYVQSGGGWVATKVTMTSGGKLRQLEEYTDVKTNVAFDAALFDPAQWSTAPHWVKR